MGVSRACSRTVAAGDVNDYRVSLSQRRDRSRRARGYATGEEMRTARVALPGTGQIVEAEVSDDAQRLRIGEAVLDAATACLAPACDGLVYGVVLNSQAALEALGESLSQPPYCAAPRAPVLYVKPWNTHAGHRACVALPRGEPEVEVLGALGVVIGSQATRIQEAEALAHVRGYTIAADLSLPQRSLYRPPIREKCFDASCPIGPWTIDREHLADPAGLEVQVDVDGSPAQRFGLRNLVRPIPRLLADVTRFLTLYPGDVVLAGIQHWGPRARPGQGVSVRIDGIGSLAFAIVESPA